jgi:hypothetical protein
MYTFDECNNYRVNSVVQFIETSAGDLPAVYRHETNQPHNVVKRMFSKYFIHLRLLLLLLLLLLFCKHVRTGHNEQSPIGNGLVQVHRMELVESSVSNLTGGRSDVGAYCRKGETRLKRSLAVVCVLSTCVFVYTNTYTYIYIYIYIYIYKYI